MGVIEQWDMMLQYRPPQMMMMHDGLIALFGKARFSLSRSR
jgi:hypothetical protein